MSINTTVRTIQDIMRKDTGVDGDAQRINQLVWMMFLKIIDDHERQRQEKESTYRSPIPESLRWRSWAGNPDGITGTELLNFVNKELFPQLKNHPANPEVNTIGSVVREAFKDAHNYMQSGHLIRQVINKLNEINFSRARDRHLLGDIYEQILRDLQNAGNAGEYYTPRAVTEFMVNMTDPKMGETVLDPACGTGGFLTCTIEHVRNKYVRTRAQERALQGSIFGIDKKPFPHLLCITNMLLHGIDEPNQIIRGNALTRRLGQYTDGDRVDVILTNPPFGGIEEDGVELNFPPALRSRETADLFLVLIIQLLRNGGRAAVVLPDGFLFGEGVKSRIREKLLRECNLHTIVRLPNGVFSPYTGIRTNLLFFQKGGPTEEVWYFEHPYPEGYKAYSRMKPLTIGEFVVESNWWRRRKESKLAWKVSVGKLIANNFNLDVRNPHVRRVCLRDPVQVLKEHDQVIADFVQAKDRLKRALAVTLSKV